MIQTGSMEFRQTRPAAVIAKLLLTVFAIETVIMFTLPLLLPADGLLRDFADSLCLALFSAPVIWWLSARPLQVAAVARQKDFAVRLLHDSAAPCFVLSPDHTVLIWNRACEELTGCRSDGMIGTDGHWSAFYDHRRPTLADLVIDGMEREFAGLYARSSRSPFAADGLQCEGWYPDVGGKRRYLFFDAVPVRTAEGELMAVIQTLADITERKTAEESLRVSEEKFSKAFRASPDGVVISGKADGRFIEVNEAFYRMFGYSRDEVVGHTSRELGIWVDPDERDRILERIDRHGMVQNVDVRFRVKSGEVRTFLWSVDVIELDDEACLIATVRDTTEQREKERQLLKSRAELVVQHEQLSILCRQMEAAKGEAERAYAELTATQAQLIQQEKMASIGQLASGVAHEINNPTGFVMSNLATLEKYAERLATFFKAQAETVAACADAGERERLAVLRSRLKIDHIVSDLPSLIAESLDGTRRIKRITQNLKSFARLDGTEPETVSLAECIESTLTIVWNELKYKADLIKEYGDLPPVRCHPQQLSQVFMNLLVNAAHAIESHGTITVRTWREGDRACVAIADTGSGIPEEIRTRIFEPFFTTKGTGRGTGLGLPISYDIVRKHDGELTLESEVGKGTTFTVSLPIGGTA